MSPSKCVWRNYKAAIVILTDAFIYYTAQKMKFAIKNFFSKCVKKSLRESFIFCAVLEIFQESLGKSGSNYFSSHLANTCSKLEKNHLMNVLNARLNFFKVKLYPNLDVLFTLNSFHITFRAWNLSFSF